MAGKEGRRTDDKCEKKAESLASRFEGGSNVAVAVHRRLASASAASAEAGETPQRRCRRDASAPSGRRDAPEKMPAGRRRCRRDAEDAGGTPARPVSRGPSAVGFMAKRTARKDAGGTPARPVSGSSRVKRLVDCRRVDENLSSTIKD